MVPQLLINAYGKNDYFVHGYLFMYEDFYKSYTNKQK